MMIKNNKIFINTALLLGIVFIVFSCDEVLFEEDISESLVNVLAPTNNTTVTTGSISFNWEKVSDADKYLIQIATPGFANARQIVLDSTISKTSFSKQLLPNTYEWRIRAENSAFETNYFTNSFTVIDVESFSDKEVELVSPTDNFISNQNSQTLSWKLVEGATEYRVQIWKPDTSGSLENDEVVSVTSMDYSFADGNYTWQVRAQTNTQNTLYFLRTLLVDTVNPNTPELKTPADKSTASDGKISFTWEREDLAGSVEFDSIYVYNDVDLKTLSFKDKSDNKQYDKDLSAENYYWFVQSFDQAGNQSDRSTVFSFEVK